MTSFADYAPAQAGERRGPSPWVAALLTVLTPGLGHLYIGQPRRGLLFFVLVMIADTLLMFAMMGVLARFWMFAVSLALLLGLWLFILIDASRARLPHARLPAAALQPMAGLRRRLRAGLADHRHPLHLCRLRPVLGPTRIFPRHRRQHGADAAHRRVFCWPTPPSIAAGSRAAARSPSTCTPSKPHLHYIKRIVAVEGDRVAVKGGRAIVNGMAVEEPYVELGPAQAASPT